MVHPFILFVSLHIHYTGDVVTVAITDKVLISSTCGGVNMRYIV